MHETPLHRQKQEWRARLRAQRAQVTPRQAQALGQAMAQLLLASPLWAQAQTVFCYLGVGGEPDTRPLAQAALRGGKGLYLPRCVPGQLGCMQLLPVQSLDGLVRSAYGLWEPAGGQPAAPGQIDLALVPCLAGTAQGWRLGQGGGYYDRFLAQFTGQSVLLCPQAALLPTLPIEPHDRPTRWVLTERALAPAQRP